MNEELIAHYDPESADKSHHCGSSHRAFIGLEHPGIPPEGKATFHVVVQVGDNATAHYHKKLMEYYIFLECSDDAGIELDGETYPMQQYSRIAIPRGVKHRVRGTRVVFGVVVMPGHLMDGSDDHFD